MAGRFITCNIKRLSMIPADIRILGTRKKAEHESWIWVPQLAPSPELFSQSQAWKRKGIWPDMWEEYKKRFLLEMTFKKKYLDRIVQRLQEDKTVAFGCFCTDFNACHRDIIANYIASQGFEVARG